MYLMNIFFLLFALTLAAPKIPKISFYNDTGEPLLLLFSDDSCNASIFTFQLRQNENFIIHCGENMWYIVFRSVSVCYKMQYYQDKRCCVVRKINEQEVTADDEQKERGNVFEAVTADKVNALIVREDGTITTCQSKDAYYSHNFIDKDTFNQLVPEFSRVAPVPACLRLKLILRLKKRNMGMNDELNKEYLRVYGMHGNGLLTGLRVGKYFKVVLVVKLK
jgi:hypothetical protein